MEEFAMNFVTWSGIAALVVAGLLILSFILYGAADGLSMLLHGLAALVELVRKAVSSCAGFFCRVRHIRKSGFSEQKHEKKP